MPLPDISPSAPDSNSPEQQDTTQSLAESSFNLRMRPQTDAFHDLVSLVERAFEELPEQGIIDIPLRQIATHDGSFGRTYRPDLFRALFYSHHNTSVEVSGVEQSALRRMDYLEIIDELMSDLAVSEMTLAERSDWIGMMNHHLYGLTLVQRWDEQQSQHLARVCSIMEKLVQGTLAESMLPEADQAAMLRHLDRLLGEPVEQMLASILNESHGECLGELIRFAGSLQATELRPALQEAYENVRYVCATFSPEDYGVGLADEIERLESDMSEDDDFGDIETDMMISRDHEPGTGYSVTDEDPRSYDEILEDDRADALEQLESIHDCILADLLPISDPVTDAAFWGEILQSTSYYRDAWMIAMKGLRFAEPSAVNGVVPLLVEAAVMDSLAASRLLDLLAYAREWGDSSLSDIAGLATADIAILPRAAQRKIIEHAESVINDGCELLEHQEDAPSILTDLKKVLRFR